MQLYIIHTYYLQILFFTLICILLSKEEEMGIGVFYALLICVTYILIFYTLYPIGTNVKHHLYLAVINYFYVDL